MKVQLTKSTLIDFILNESVDADMTGDTYKSHCMKLLSDKADDYFIERKEDAEETCSDASEENSHEEKFDFIEWFDSITKEFAEGHYFEELDRIKEGCYETTTCTNIQGTKRCEIVIYPEIFTQYGNAAYQRHDRT